MIRATCEKQRCRGLETCLKRCPCSARCKIPPRSPKKTMIVRLERCAFSEHFPPFRSSWGASFAECQLGPRRILRARRHRARQRHFSSTLRDPQNNTAHWFWLPSQWFCRSNILLVSTFEPVRIKRGYKNVEAFFSCTTPSHGFLPDRSKG